MVKLNTKTYIYIIKDHKIYLKLLFILFLLNSFQIKTIYLRESKTKQNSIKADNE